MDGSGTALLIETALKLLPSACPLDCVTVHSLTLCCGYKFSTPPTLFCVCGRYRYFIPEDGDTEANPNVFLAPKPSRPGYPPTLEQIKASFPLPGKYHFRFKSTLIPGVDKGPAVWMDCVDDSQPVAVYKNSIIAKVTRISL